MSLNKTLLLLAVGLALTAGACTNAPRPTESTSTENGDFVRTEIDSITARIYDRKNNVVCYKYAGESISCIKL